MKQFYALILGLSCSLPALAGFDDYALGARSAGIGHASVALRGDLWAAHNNQAGLAWITGIQGGFYYENRFLVRELGMKAAALAVPVKQGVFGAEVSSFGYSQYSENKYGLSFSRKFGERVAASVQLDYLSTRIGENYGKTGTPAGEIGIIAMPVKNLYVGAHVFNPTRSRLASYNDERVPTVMRFGANYVFSKKVFLAAEIEKDSDFKPVIRGGVEYRPVDEFYLRAGMATNPGLSCFGIGLRLKKFQVDLSSTFHSVLGFTPQIGLTYGITGDPKP